MTLTSDQSIDQALADYRVKLAAARTANEGVLFAGYQETYCFDCAGMALQGSLVLGRKGQKNFSGFNGENVRRLEGADLEAEIAMWAEHGLTLSCECGKVVA